MQSLTIELSSPSVNKIFGIFWGTYHLIKPRSHYAGGISKRRYQFENAPKVFRSAGRIWKCNTHRSLLSCVWGKLGQRDHVIIVTPPFSKSSVFKMFSVHSRHENKTSAFSNSSDLKDVFEKLCFRDGLIKAGVNLNRSEIWSIIKRELLGLK